MNQALVFYHFGTVDDLLAAACQANTAARVVHYVDSDGAQQAMAALDQLAVLVEVVDGLDPLPAERCGRRVRARAKRIARK
jgi:hypothetical protein